MLVLSRKLNEEIVIDGGIRVRILEITGNRVRLGIDAPSTVGILREEITKPRSRNRLSQNQAPDQDHSDLVHSLTCYR